MHFNEFLTQAGTFITNNADLGLICGSTLLMFMLAVYLLIKHTSIWHTLTGAVVALVAIAYFLAVTNLLDMDAVVLAVDNVTSLLYRFVLQLFGLLYKA